MLLTDHEWLRFVTFGMVTGAILGAVNTGALLLQGWGMSGALIAAILFVATLALVVHAIIRYLLDTAAERAVSDDEGDADEEAEEVAA